jgi:methylenetetrahydrofolate dehydrogenase (NADP+)/methenyltetrahydrofolate cyclohydrolase
VLDEHASIQDAVDLIQRINKDQEVHGILINKPVPPSIDFYTLINSIAAHKDIEGMNLINLGKLWMNKSRLWPCTPAAAMALLKSSGISLTGKHAVIIGRSEIVGKPMALLLLKEDMTVTICHSKTAHLKEEVRRADVVVAAVGKASFVKADWIKQDAIVIDVGINSHEGKVVGDVDFESCKQKASFITPVPGGVGPVTALILMKNTVEAFKQSL